MAPFLVENWAWLSAILGGLLGAVVCATALYLRVQETHHLVRLIWAALHDHTHDSATGRAVLPSTATAVPPVVQTWPL